MTRAIPEGYHSITPHLVVRDARKVIDFHKRAFGAEELLAMPGPDGRGIMHAELRIGDSLIMMGEEDPQQPCRSAETAGGSPVSFYLYVEDVDEAFRRAVEAGATSRMAVQEMFWGDRAGTVQAPFGYSWTIATHTRDLTIEEIRQGAQAAFAEMAAAAELVITRTFTATREVVWRAWTEPDRVVRWWGPKNFTCPHCRIDLRVGGFYLSCMRSPEGQDYWSTGIYREIVAPSRLVCTDSFADEGGKVVPASHYGMTGEWPDELLIMVTFEEQEGRTLLTLRHRGIPAGEMRDQCAAGWNESLDKLATYLANEGKGP